MRTIIQRFTVVGCLLGLFACQEMVQLSPARLTNNPKLTTLDQQVDSVLNQIDYSQLNTVGVSIGILKQGTMSFYGYGEIRKETSIVPARNTYFEIGSITKTFTAVAVMKMLMEESNQVDTKIRSYLPTDLPTLNRNGTELTFKHLLTHTSGLPYMPDNLTAEFYLNTAKGWQQYDQNKLLTYLKNVRLSSDPFTRFQYSNTGMGVLGYILSRRNNLDYGRVIARDVLQPIGMKETTAYFEETDATRWATGYANGKETAYWKTLKALDGAGVLKSTTDDMLRYAAFNLTPTNTPVGRAVLACQTLYYPVYDVREHDKVRGCLGWFEYTNNKLPGETFLFHNGGTGGFNSELYISKKNQSALVILYNTDGSNDARQQLTSGLLKLISRN